MIKIIAIILIMIIISSKLDPINKSIGQALAKPIKLIIDKILMPIALKIEKIRRDIDKWN
ncbi:MAG TPA: hypothetical protein PLG34_13925 [Spirochaetota bacterium]|nr:hypothetical protein [Spirochaetota bacterium]